MPTMEPGKVYPVLAWEALFVFVYDGCVEMTDVDHLHTKAMTLKVGEHLKTLCSQFLATCLQPDHVSFPIVTADSVPRRIKQSLQTGFSDQINDLLVDGYTTDIKEVRRGIHTRTVREAIGGRCT